ncbi:hypothetical protein [Burkholderia multivorans]|uniref:hypothetical protein n=1 Tax=Burkholderia multivorans TaxID=87883 RepID=UPI001C222776|nr:hypothetical protein [Burkholderia multivorans]MBU9311855.1 hypothetical protein [Burkholderia multivorans]
MHFPVNSIPASLVFKQRARTPLKQCRPITCTRFFLRPMTDNNPAHLRKLGEPLPAFDSIEAAADWTITALFRLYILISPDKSADDFASEVLIPIAQSSVENPAQIQVHAFENHSRQSFMIYMRNICLACAYVQAAQDADREGRERVGWSHIANAHYLLGFAEGVFALEPALAGVISARSKSGSTQRDAKYEPLRQLARELAASGSYPSKRNAALSIKAQIVAESQSRGINLSDAQAERTITKWLDGMTFARKR